MGAQWSGADIIPAAISDIPREIQDILQSKVALERIAKFLNRPEVEPLDWDESKRIIAFNDAIISWPKSDSTDIHEGTPNFILKDMRFRIPENCFTLVCGPLGSGKTLLVSTL